MPNYKLIFSDIIDRKYPEKRKDCQNLLNKENLTSLDIIQLNQNIFGAPDKKRLASNQMHKAYNVEAIIEILTYQKKNRMSNSKIAKHFRLSRNTISKWKRLFDSKP